MNKRNGLNGLARFQPEIWKLICVRRDAEKERCHLCNEMNKIHILLKLNGKQEWQKKIWNIKSIHINEEISHKKIISCTKIKELKNFGTFLYKLNCRWENQAERTVQGIGKLREEVL
jgi:hypothetical protein